MFIAATHGSQKNISTFLEENVLTSLISANDGIICRNQIYQIICKYYLSPCGSVPVYTPPSSICPEDCSAVQRECPAAWEAAQLGLKNYNFISCDDSSAFLFPLPTCCTGLGQPTEEGIYFCRISCTGKVVCFLTMYYYSTLTMEHRVLH